jgi:hypothetical protein
MRDHTDETIYMPPARLTPLPNRDPYRITGELELVDFDRHARTDRRRTSERGGGTSAADPMHVGVARRIRRTTRRNARLAPRAGGRDGALDDRRHRATLELLGQIRLIVLGRGA